MDEGDTSKDDKGSVKSSSSDDSPRLSADREEDKNNVLIEVESLNVDGDHHAHHGDKANQTRHSDSENSSTDERNNGDSDSENQKHISMTSGIAYGASGLDAGSPNRTSRTTEILEEHDSDSATLNEKSEPPSKAEESDSDSGNEKSEPHNNAEESDSDSENQKHISMTSGIADGSSGLDAGRPNRTSREILEEHDSNSGTLNKKSAHPSKAEESDSDSGTLNKNGSATSHVHVVDKDSDSDSEKLAEKSQPPKLENDSESDSNNATTNDIPVDEKEISLTHETSDNVGVTVEEVIEIKEIDPVFDGTETPEMEARRGSSSQSVDLFPESPSNTWPGKAAAFKNLVKMKGAFAVSNVLRRLSGGHEDPEQPEEEEKGVIVETAVEEPVMMGRIILYSRLGCQESQEVRSFMRQKGLHVTEINVDIFPGRKLELEKNTGSSAVPRVYFNDILVGGLSELKSVAEDGKLDDQIRILMHEEPSPDAPWPPLDGEDDVSATGKMDELASIYRKMKESIFLSDRFSKLRRFSNCFVGSEAVDFLSQYLDLEREEAVELGRKLVKARFFRHVLDENVFEDGNHLYRFLEHDPLISTNCYNMTRGLNKLKPKRVTEIASRLRFLSFAMIEAYVSEDGRQIDYRSIQGCEEFRRYLRVIEELQRVEVDYISREERLAFFINLYNMMAIHALLTWGYPTGAADRKRLFGEFKYVVGGCPYSLSAIQNGVLRGNQRPPYNISKPFGPKDMRFKVALPYVEPLVHFALVCGNRSGPPLRCYSPGDIDMELMEAARNFLRNGGLIVDAEAKTASTSSIIRWYSTDFGKNESEVMKHLSNYLEPSKSQELLDLLACNQLKVTYQPYDWDMNG